MDIKLINQLIGKQFTIDCSMLILRQDTTVSDGIEYSGPGLITQGEGIFTFKLFPKKIPKNKDIFSQLFGLQPGKLLQDSEYFHLSATSINGDQWEAERIRPTYNVNIPENSCVISGNFRQMKCETVFSNKNIKREIAIFFPGNIEIPCNTPTQTIKRVCGEDRKISSILNIAKVQAAGFEFEIERSDNWLSVLGQYNFDITRAITIRILEALQFVLMRPLHWCIMEITQEMKKDKIIRAPLVDIDRASRYPAVPLDSTTNGVWDLFKIYLENYICHNSEAWHPTFSSIYRLIQANATPLATEALVLSIAVEGVLKSEFRNVGIPGRKWDRLISQTRGILNDSSIDSSIKKRLLSALGQMTDARAKDRLYALSEERLICKRHIKAWEKLRNSSAHAADFEDAQLQEFLDKLHAVYVLFYQLIFLSIGYSGEYVDYSDQFKSKRFDA
jgi:hypothetical protein